MHAASWCRTVTAHGHSTQSQHPDTAHPHACRILGPHWCRSRLGMWMYQSRSQHCKKEHYTRTTPGFHPALKNPALKNRQPQPHPPSPPRTTTFMCCSTTYHCDDLGAGNCDQLGQSVIVSRRVRSAERERPRRAREVPAPKTEKMSVELEI